jgi:RNA polymerase subunit RPABC4/transcription elongation factor Spt4
MNTETQKLHSSLRNERAAKIIGEPEKYKVCDQCQSIAFKAAHVCPICHAYRWREGYFDIIEVAQLTTQSAFPVTAGTVPRLQVTQPAIPYISG